MSSLRPDHFASDWLAAWNAHDLERVLSHYSDDIEMWSPAIARVMGGVEGGVEDLLQGKDRVRAYWAKALAQFPDLKFTHICTMAGVNSIVIHYLGATGKRVAEVLQFNNEGLVVRAHAHYEV